MTHNGSGVKYAWRINNVNKDKWYTLFAKSAQVKEEWMDAFKRERQRVDEDRQKGMNYSMCVTTLEDNFIKIRICCK